ncbi:MAG: UbiA family prenyltransferase [Methanothrix sp.]|jgi:4-hydroxybenzoate polyprenyltransferase|uniref:UbiA family prenyltransferase n=1 Tax=Methanothrix sp. TaxID=90426 RepID=UPI00247B6BDE|nr:UbiA family prenyltransferase [Methanothrix sp.]
MDVRAYLELLRPPLAPMDLALPAAAALLSAYATTGSLPGAAPFLIATIGAYFATTSAYVFNDYVDVDVDRVAMPGRPIPSSKVSRRGAGIYAIILLVLAAAAAAYLNPESLVMLFAATAIITVYSAWAKRRTPLSWLFVGLAYGMVPVGVWLAISPAGFLMPGPGFHPAALILGLMICITDWGFTNCDASRDVPGDRAKGIPTTPATYGIPLTSRLVAAFWTAGVILSVLLGISSGLGALYHAAAILSGVWMLIQCADFVRNPTPSRGEKLFYQGANYRAVLFAALMLDVLIGAMK